MRYKSTISFILSVTGVFLLTLANDGFARSPSYPSTDASTIVLAGPFAPESFRGTWYRLVYTEAFQRLGLKFHYTQLPLRRATLMASRGEVDGEAGRVDVYHGNLNNLVKVPVVLWQARFVVLVSKPDLQIDNWRSLGKLKGIIDYRRGVWLAEQKLRKFVPSDNLNAVTHPGQALERLRMGRSVAYVDVDDVVDRVLDKPLAGHQPRIFIAGTLCQKSIFPFLNKSHAALVPRLTKVLLEMQQQGAFQRYALVAERDTSAVPDPGSSAEKSMSVPAR